MRAIPYRTTPIDSELTLKARYPASRSSRRVFQKMTLCALLRRSISARRERRHARQFAAFEPFEKGAAGGRDVAEIVDDPGGGEGRDRVAAAGDAHQLGPAGQLGDFFGDRRGGAVEGRSLESADRAVPHQGAR